MTSLGVVGYAIQKGWRPKLSSEEEEVLGTEVFQSLFLMIKLCWEKDSEDRPTIDNIVSHINDVLKPVVFGDKSLKHNKSPKHKGLFTMTTKRQQCQFQSLFVLANLLALADDGHRKDVRKAIHNFDVDWKEELEKLVEDAWSSNDKGGEIVG